MEGWLIIHKFALLLFVLWQVVYLPAIHMAPFVLSILLYFCVNMGVHLVKKWQIKRMLLLASGVIIVIASMQVCWLFVFLLPATLMELLGAWVNSGLALFVIAALPIIYLHPDTWPSYVLIAFFTYGVYHASNHLAKRQHQNERQLDDLRIGKYKLMQKIQDHDSYTRQAAYVVKLEERNKLSQEIHDDVGHTITGALIQMEAAKKLLTVNPDKAAELLQNAIGITQSGIENIRLTLKNMKPTVEQVGLNRLQLLTDEFARQHDEQVYLTHDGDLDLITPIQWKVIVDNVTEAFTNIQKYASSYTKVVVEVHVLNKLVKTVVKDDGKGAQTIVKGMGLMGMEERTAAIHGTIIMDTTDGFTVTTLLPIMG